MGNRNISKSQVKKLYDSFNEYPDIALATPIIVNSDMAIIDGQHRFEALKKLKLPINYIVFPKLKLSDVQVLNSSTKTWNPTDYARSFAELGNKNYKIYLDYKKKYGLSHHVLIMILTMATNSGGSTVKTFRTGKFKVGDLVVAERLASQLQDIKNIYSRGDSRVFAVAFKRIATNPQYDHNRMMTKIREHGKKVFTDAAYSEEYMRQLERIYNFRAWGEVGRVKLF